MESFIALLHKDVTIRVRNIDFGRRLRRNKAVNAVVVNDLVLILYALE